MQKRMALGLQWFFCLYCPSYRSISIYLVQVISMAYRFIIFWIYFPKWYILEYLVLISKYIVFIYRIIVYSSYISLHYAYKGPLPTSLSASVVISILVIAILTGARWSLKTVSIIFLWWVEMVNSFFSKYCLFMFLLLRRMYSIQMLTFDWMTWIFNILLKFYLSMLCVHLSMYMFEHMFHGVHGESENKWGVSFLLLPRGSWELNSVHQS